MRHLTPEQIGLDYRALLDLIGEDRLVDLVGEDRLIDLIGEDRLIDLVGEDRLIDLIGEDRLLADLLRRKGAQWLRAAIERSPQQQDTPGEQQVSAPPENLQR